MAQLANIVINDGAATPLAHTFTPAGKPSGSEYDYFVERTSGKVDFQSEVRLRTVSPSQKGQPHRVILAMLLPKTVTSNGVEVLDFQNRVDITFTCAPNGVTQARKDLRTLAANLLNNSQIVAAVDNLENTF